jgi:hypothetical protein
VVATAAGQQRSTDAEVISGWNRHVALALEVQRHSTAREAEREPLAAFEQPKLFGGDLRECVRDLQ